MKSNNEKYIQRREQSTTSFRNQVLNTIEALTAEQWEILTRSKGFDPRGLTTQNRRLSQNRFLRTAGVLLDFLSQTTQTPSDEHAASLRASLLNKLLELSQNFPPEVQERLAGPVEQGDLAEPNVYQCAIAMLDHLHLLYLDERSLVDSLSERGSADTMSTCSSSNTLYRKRSKRSMDALLCGSQSSDTIRPQPVVNPREWRARVAAPSHLPKRRTPMKPIYQVRRSDAALGTNHMHATWQSRDRHRAVRLEDWIWFGAFCQKLKLHH